MRFGLPSYTFFENGIVGSIEVIKEGAAPLEVGVNGGIQSIIYCTVGNVSWRNFLFQLLFKKLCSLLHYAMYIVGVGYNFL